MSFPGPVKINDLSTVFKVNEMKIIVSLRNKLYLNHLENLNTVHLTMTSNILGIVNKQVANIIIPMTHPRQQIKLSA